MRFGDEFGDLDMTEDDFNALRDCLIQELKNPLAVFALLVTDAELMEEFEAKDRQQIEIRKQCIRN